MELLFAIEEDARRTLRRERLFRNRTDILENYDDDRLIRDFRFPKTVILEIVNMCNSLERKIKQKQALPVHIQVLATLRFLARGTFQDDDKDIIGVSQPSISRSINDVCDILCRNASTYIKFPNEEEKRKNKIKFFSMRGIPNVIGVIDGSHIFIHSPPGPLEPMFVCRKGGHSINVQVICDADNFITNIVAKWPGSTHDSFMWHSCGIRQMFLRENPRGFLLGDSGYPSEPWLLTPYESASCITESHHNYNKAFCSTRSIVERTIGLWKSVFRRISVSGGKMMYKPAKACKFILASAVLHNIRRKLKLREDETFLNDYVCDITEDLSAAPVNESHISQKGRRVRDQIREGYFNT